MTPSLRISLLSLTACASAWWWKHRPQAPVRPPRSLLQKGGGSNDQLTSSPSDTADLSSRADDHDDGDDLYGVTAGLRNSRHRRRRRQAVGGQDMDDDEEEEEDDEDEEEYDASAWQQCETWEKVLREADRRIVALRNAFDSYLRITHASTEDAELACGALYRVAELAVEDGLVAESSLADRRLAQLLEVVECRVGELSVACVCRCAWALSVLGLRGPDDLLDDLEHACACRVSDAPSAAAACRAFACASAAFGGAVGHALRDAVTRTVLSAETSLQPAEAADVATALAATFVPEADDEPHTESDEVDALVDRLMSSALFHAEDETCLATAACSLAKLLYAAKSASLKRETADALAEASARRREAIAADHVCTAKVAWALVRFGRPDEARRLLSVYLDGVSDSDDAGQRARSPEEATRLAWALAACLPDHDVARRLCRSLVTEGSSRLDEFAWSQRSRLLWAAAVLECDVDDYDRSPRWLKPVADDVPAQTDQFAAGLGVLLASLEVSPVDDDDTAAGRPTLGCACRAAWAARALGAPSDALFALAEARAAMTADADPHDVARALCAAHAYLTSSSSKSATAQAIVAPQHLARLAVNSLDDDSDDELATRAAGCIARLCGTNYTTRIATPARFRRLVAAGKARFATDLVAAAGVATDVLPIDHKALVEGGALDVSKIKARDAASLLPPLATSPLANVAPFLEPLALELVVADSNDTSLPVDLVTGLCKACAALAARGVVLASLASALQDALDRRARLRPTKLDVLHLAAGRTALAAVEPLKSVQKKFEAKGRLFKDVLRSVLSTMVHQLRPPPAGIEDTPHTGESARSPREAEEAEDDDDDDYFGAGDISETAERASDGDELHQNGSSHTGLSATDPSV